MQLIGKKAVYVDDLIVENISTEFSTLILEFQTEVISKQCNVLLGDLEFICVLDCAHSR